MLNCFSHRGESTMAKHSLSDAQILAQIPQARRREAEDRERGFRAESARWDRRTHRLVVELTNGMLFAFPRETVAALRGLTDAEIVRVSVFAGGAGLRWDAQDIDLSVAGILIAAIPSRDRVRELARYAGSATSRAKASAARKNGTKGGRPRKVVTAKGTSRARRSAA
jgi:hypothetical protein